MPQPPLTSPRTTSGDIGRAAPASSRMNRFHVPFAVAPAKLPYSVWAFGLSDRAARFHIRPGRCRCREVTSSASPHVVGLKSPVVSGPPSDSNAGVEVGERQRHCSVLRDRCRPADISHQHILRSVRADQQYFDVIRQCVIEVIQRHSHPEQIRRCSRYDDRCRVGTCRRPSGDRDRSVLQNWFAVSLIVTTAVPCVPIPVPAFRFDQRHVERLVGLPSSVSRHRESSPSGLPYCRGEGHRLRRYRIIRPGHAQVTPPVAVPPARAQRHRRVPVVSPVRLCRRYRHRLRLVVS